MSRLAKFLVLGVIGGAIITFLYTVSLSEKVLADASVRNTGLTRHHHDLETASVQQPNRVDGVRKQHHPLETIEIPDVFDHGAVAIEKNGRT